MQVHSDINNLPLFKKAVVTIGTFDGVHTGHLQILHQLQKEAKEINGESVIITFHPHPRMVLDTSAQKKYEEIKLLNTLSEKIELLQKQNIDHLVIVPFTLSFSEQSAEGYIKDFLVSKFHPHTIIIGYDHHFGKKRQGNYKLLEFYQTEFNFKVNEIPEHVLHNVTISSTKIRHALDEGDTKTANEYLGYSYFFEGTVIEGNKLGGTLGYPTANIFVSDKNKLVPKDGVYAVEVLLPDESTAESTNTYFKGMMNIGMRPTVGGTKKVIEVNIFDFDDTIYNQKIRISVHHFLRNEIKFNGLDALKDQLASDKINARTLFSLESN